VIGKVEVEVGGTACGVPHAAQGIAKLAARGDEDARERASPSGPRQAGPHARPEA
jgi:hypothetical protein